MATNKRVLKSPIGMTPAMLQMKREVSLAQGMAELIRLHNALLQKADLIAAYVIEVRNEAARIKKLPKGDKGDRGDAGPRGAPGRNAPTIEEILAQIPMPKDGKDGASPDLEAVAALVMARLTMPKDGKDAIIDHEQIVKDIYEKFIKDIDWRKIPGLENEMASYRNQLAGKVYGRNTWARGGGSSGGSSDTQVTSEVVSGSGTAFTLANTPTAGTVKLFANGQRLTPVVDFTISGPNITTVLSWDAGTILADYSYA